MALHADLGAEITHHGWDRVRHDERASIGQLKHVIDDGPIAGLTSAVNGPHSHIVFTSTHAHGRGHDVFAPFLR